MDGEAYLAYAHALSQRIAAFCADTGVRIPASASSDEALVSCGCSDQHFVRTASLETHLVRSIT